ncbi:MAG: prepilin peptidase [Planctomycetes bacterium]|nr:prepilin peptidase [Planctomycetota bacterium]
MDEAPNPELVLFYVGLFRVVSLFALIVAAAYADVAHGHIPNWLTLPAVAIGLLTSFWNGDPSEAGPRVVQSAVGAGLGFGILSLFYLRNQVGGGDVKLMAAVGSFLGFPLVVTGMVYISIVGALLAFAISIREGRLLASLRGLPGAFLLRGGTLAAATAGAAGTAGAPEATGPGAASPPPQPSPLELERAGVRATPPPPPPPSLAPPPPPNKPTIPFAVAIAGGTLWTWIIYAPGAAATLSR